MAADEIEQLQVEESSWMRFPPRLPEQPIFYPVENEEYAIQIARDWNPGGDCARNGSL